MQRFFLLRSKSLLRGALAGAVVVVVTGAGCSRLENATPPGDDDGGSGGNGVSTGGSSGGRDGGGGAGHPSGDASASSGAGSSASDGPRGPTPATASANFPFPQNRQSNRCAYPTHYTNADVQAAYTKWKADLVTSANAGGHRRVQRTANDLIDGCRPLNSTVSEGIGYGMLIAVYMNDQSLFDDLWLYEQTKLKNDPSKNDGNPVGLMNWAPDGSGSDCGGAATDADEDMAFALAMADKQWPGTNAIGKSYHDAAVQQIDRIYVNEIYQWKYVAGGDWSGFTNGNVNPSYLAPSYYRVFATLDPKSCASGTAAGTNNCHGWLDVVTQSYATISDALTNGNGSNGLVPAWCNDGTPGSCGAAGSPQINGGAPPFFYQYDSCRTPFRIGLDWCHNGEARAQLYVGKTSSFFSGIGAKNIVDGYSLTGSPMAQNAGKLSAAFIGPAGVGGMAGGPVATGAYQQLVDDAYSVVAGDSAFAGGEYYESSWTVLSLLMLTGNFLDYTQESPAH